MIIYEEELRAIFGDKYQGCTQEGDELIEYRLKPGEVATTDELTQVGALTLPRSTHLAVLVSIDIGATKPATVRRDWQGIEYSEDCFVTENIKDQYQAGDIAVGDTVLVEFLEGDNDRALVIAKIFKTW